jgi:hypothetical protein
LTQHKPVRLLKKTYRLLFLYLFRDFDEGTLDVGLEFTTLLPLRGGIVMCRALTLNHRGLSRDSFLADQSNRRILSMPGRYICYWVHLADASAHIYNRIYQKRANRSYVHKSDAAKSEIVFDDNGIEVRAENLVSSPRRYYEKFIRLLRF